MSRSLEYYESKEFLREYAKDEVKDTWRYVNYVLSNDELFEGYGFTCPKEEVPVAIVYRAGDRVHPELGYDFLGSDWRQIEESTLFSRLDKREEAARQVFERFLSLLETKGYDEAFNYAEHGSKNKVLYVSRNPEETLCCIEEMLNHGLGRNELSCNFTERRSDTLVIAYDENLSYYYLGEN